MCSNITAIEDYVIELPKGVKVLSVPDNIKVGNDVVSYTATHKLKGNVLTVNRTLNDRTKGNIRSPQAIAEYNKVVEKALDSLKEQVLYK